MRALEDMRGELTPEENAVYRDAINAALAIGDHRQAGYISGRRLAGIPGTLEGAERNLLVINKGDYPWMREPEKTQNVAYCEGFIAGWREGASE